MAADAINGNIGKLFRKTSTVATFDDFAQLCEKANNNIKAIVLGLPFIYPFSKKTRTRWLTKRTSYERFSWGSVQRRKQHVTLQRILPQRKLYHRQLFGTFFLKKRWFENLPYTEHWTLTLHNQNVTISLTRWKVYHNRHIPSGIAFTATTRPRIYAALETF